MYPIATRIRATGSERWPFAAFLALLAVIAAALFAPAASAQTVTQTGLQGYYRTGAPGAANPTAGQNPAGSPGWTPIDPNGQNNGPITIPVGGHIWIAVENDYVYFNKKTLWLNMLVSPTGKAKHLGNSRVPAAQRPQAGGYDNAGNAINSSIAVGYSYGWVKVKAEFDEQPAWEWIKLTNTHNLPITITIDKIRITTKCKTVQDRLRNAMENQWSMDMYDASFGVDGHMVNNTRITQIEIYPERADIDMSEPPTMEVDPATGVWFHEYTFVDPHGDFHPHGGVRWICAGPGLAAQQSYDMSLPLIGVPDRTFYIFAYDEDGGEHQEFFVNRGGLPWYETFSWHEPLNGMHGQWDWMGWDDDPAFDAEVTDLIAHSDGLSLDVKDQADVVNAFEGADSGKWAFSAWQYIPSDYQSGGASPYVGSYFLLLNTYEPGGDHDWSVSYNFDSNDGMLKVYYGDGLNTVDVPYETDRWVKLEAVIDLDNDWTQVYYDDNLVTEYSWTGGVFGNGGGALDIAAVDLWANSSTSIFYDDLLLEPIDEPAEPCPADINGDGAVDVVDLLELLSAWGGGGPADINGDGIVDVQDLLELLSAWGPCA